MADEGPEHDEQGENNKGRTVFGIGLPAAVQAASKASATPPVARPPAPVAGLPAPMAGRPAPMKRPEADDPLLRKPAAAVPDSSHTLHALPGQLVGAVTGQTIPTRAPERDDAALRRPQTGDFSATTPDLGPQMRATRVQNHGGLEGPPEPKAHIRLIAGKAIPGTRYRLLRWLGEGGMGVVYEAEHIDIERRVALKILRTELSERSDTAQVFREEARAAAKAGSKNNVEIFDFGELPDGRLFFCMELLNGADLAALTEAEIEPGRVFAILRQICKGLGAAHKAGVVHRDVKPENVILVQSEGRRDMVKIVDFGVAAILSRGEGSGQIAGTPQYMPPEQISGGAFDGRLDIYALGCVAYEMLVQHPPFTQENLADVLLAQINTVPPRPSEARPGAGPKALEDVVMRCLEKDPNKRPKDMAELEALLCEAQIAAGVVSEWDDLPLPDVEPERRANLVARMPSLHAEAAPRRRWLLPLVAVGAAALTGVALLLLISPEVPPEVVAQIETLSQEAREAAAGGLYVDAPEPSDPTALRKLDALEAIEGPGEDLADKAGQTLRKEFSAQLLTVADKFWNIEATQPLAYDYYDWVLYFDPDNALAKERSMRTDKEREEMRGRMLAGTLRESEKAGATIASAALAPEADKKKWDRRLTASANKMPLSKSIAAQEAMRGAGLAPPAAEPAPVAKPAVKEPVAVPVADPVPVDPPVVEEPKKGPKGPGKKRVEEEEGEVEAAVKRDPGKASELAGQGTAALNGGRRTEAEGLFNQAISYDRKCAEALIGLSDIYFDRGSSTKAQRYAEQAVAIAPNNGSYRIKLGDAYYNALRYRDALTQYEKAQQLGDGKAGPRIAKVKGKLGP